MEIGPIESRSSSIVLCAVTQQIQPKLAVTLVQCRARILNDPMVGGYAFLLTSMPNFRQISEIHRSPITQGCAGENSSDRSKLHSLHSCCTTGPLVRT